MSEIIRVLQLGTENWKTKYELPDYVRLEYTEVFRNVPRTPYDIVFVDRELLDVELPLLHQATKAHTLFVTDKEVWNDGMQYYYDCKKGKRLLTEHIRIFAVLLHKLLVCTTFNNLTVFQHINTVSYNCARKAV